MATVALESLRRLASRPDLVEYWVAYDPDDPETGEWAAGHDVCSWQAPYRFGWAGHGKYTMRLAELCQGEWLMSWGDDARMLTPGWDEAIRNCRPGVLYLRGDVRDNTFPVVHRRVLTAMGDLPSPFVDSWITKVGMAANCLQMTAIKVMEDRFDLTGRNNDEVWREGSIHRYEAAEDEFHSEPMIQLRAEQAQRVREELYGA